MSDLYREGMLVVATYQSGATVRGRLVCRADPESGYWLGIRLTSYFYVWVCKPDGTLHSPDDITDIKVIEAFPEPTGLGALVVIPANRPGNVQRVIRDWNGRWVTEYGERVDWHAIAPHVIGVITHGSTS